MMSFNQIKKCLSVVCFVFLGVTYLNAQNDSIKQSEENFIHPSVIEGDLKCITVPNKFEPSDLFNGYLRKDVSASIVVSEVKELNYIQITDGYTDAFLESQEMNLINKEKFISDNGIKGTLFKVDFLVKDIPITRYMLFAGTLDKTIWINISYPSKFEELLSPEFEKTLKSLKL